MLDPPISEPTHNRATSCRNQKVEAVIEVHDSRLVLVEGQPPGRQPLCQACLDLLGLFLGAAQGDQIVGIPDHDGGIPPQLTSMGASELIADPGGPFHPVQGDVQQQGAGHAALGSSLLGRSEAAILDHPCLQPALDQPPSRERADRLE
jgi:hypothetical protein